MVNAIVTIIIFISLYIVILWISFLYLYEDKNKKTNKTNDSGQSELSATIAVPAHNEEKTLKQTVESLLNLDYPKSKLNIVIINNGSTDDTQTIAEDLALKYKNVSVINKKGSGKAAALNSALKQCKAELFACMDADSCAEKDALKNIVRNFGDKHVGAVISAVQVASPKNIYQKVQYVEYLLAILMRKIMAFINTLAITPGVLSVYRTDALTKTGGFDEKSYTEDFEIAMRLKYHHYKINIEPLSLTYTYVPKTFSALWRQRVRWYRGFIECHMKYWKIFFNKKYNLFGCFQLPLNILAIPVIIISSVFIVHGTVNYLFQLLKRSILINGFFTDYLFKFTGIKDIILAQNTMILLPIIVATILTAALVYASHRVVNRKIRYPFSIWAFFIAFPLLSALHWVGAITEQIFKLRKRW